MYKESDADGDDNDDNNDNNDDDDDDDGDDDDGPFCRENRQATIKSYAHILLTAATAHRVEIAKKTRKELLQTAATAHHVDVR